MDPKLISDYLQRVPKRLYKAQVGEEISIELPRVPLTGDTEFLQLKTEIEGEEILEEMSATGSSGEGLLMPRSLIRRALKPGKSRIVIRAYDSLTQARIPDVEPLDIEIEIT